MIPLIVISLRRSKHRRASVAAHLDALHLPFSFFDAIDGNELPIEEVRAASRRPCPQRPGPLLPTELGCIASFREVCRRIASGKEEFVCVLEDDVILDGRIRSLLELSMLRRLPSFDILRIHATNSLHSLPLGVFDGFSLHAPYWPGWGMYAQIFSRTGASKTAKGLARPWMAGDMMVFHDCRVPGLRIVEVTPPLASHPQASDDSSTIDPEGARRAPRATPSRYERLRLSAYTCLLHCRLLRNFIRQWGFYSLICLVPGFKSRCARTGVR